MPNEPTKVIVISEHLMHVNSKSQNMISLKKKKVTLKILVMSV